MSLDRAANVALIGCGNISRRYAEGIARFPELQLRACADAVPAAASRLAEELGITAHGTIAELLADGDIDMVVNITPPLVHAEVTIAALEAGKHVYVEKPIAVSLDDALRMEQVAAREGRLLGSAPDTFLGSAGQTARAAIDDGKIGEPLAALAFITHSRAERWHPDPTFLFQPGGGPLLDLGPYYVTTLVNLLGPIASVSGTTRIGARTRRVTAAERTVDTIEATTTTHASATLDFMSGAVGTLVASFDIWESHLPKIELFGTEGALTLPDPNQFDGPVTVRRIDDTEWRELAPVLPVDGEPDTPSQFLRGLGVADLWRASFGAPLRVGSSLARHVLEVLDGIERSSASGERIEITSRPDRPAPRRA